MCKWGKIFRCGTVAIYDHQLITGFALFEWTETFYCPSLCGKKSILKAGIQRWNSRWKWKLAPISEPAGEAGWTEVHFQRNYESEIFLISFDWNKSSASLPVGWISRSSPSLPSTSLPARPPYPPNTGLLIKIFVQNFTYYPVCWGLGFLSKEYYEKWAGRTNQKGPREESDNVERRREKNMKTKKRRHFNKSVQSLNGEKKLAVRLNYILSLIMEMLSADHVSE